MHTAVFFAFTAIVTPVDGGNALTLPAQRHWLRMTPGGGSPVSIVAVQKDGADGHGLVLVRSDDDARSWHYYAAIQDDPSERDEADLIAVGDDIALVYSYEGPVLSGSSRHDVYFQRWRYGSGDWSPDPAVLIFDSSSSSSAFSRAELARDSQGRIWVQAFRMESDGSSTVVMSVSTNGGASFTRQPDLDHLSARGGGRILSLGSTMVLVFDAHGVQPAHFRTRSDSDALSSWSATQTAFSEGIYHGAALSAVADGAGGMDLAYIDESSILYHRHFNGSSFGPATTLEDTGDWALQPALTRIGGDLVVFYNRVIATNTDYEIRTRTFHNGWSAPSILDSQAVFKGYPTIPESLPTSMTWVGAIFGVTPDADSTGTTKLYTRDWSPTAPPPPPPHQPDLGAPPPPRDAGVPLPPADAGVPPMPAGAVLFEDHFDRHSPDVNTPDALGASWTTTGYWFADGRALSDQDTSERATEIVASCRDCTVSAGVNGFGVPEVGVFLRANGASDYDAILTGSGQVQIRREQAGGTVVLGQGPSGLSDLGVMSTLTLTATGASPVSLVATVNGRVVATASDSGSAALTGAGRAGMWTTRAGVVFDDFVLTAEGGAAAPPPDLGVRHDLAARPPDLATRPPDLAARPPDLAARPPDLATRPADLATRPADLAAPPLLGTLFSDSFDRNSPDVNTPDALGSSWSTLGYWFADGRALSDQDTNERATEIVVSCGDCRVAAIVIGFGVPEVGVFLRALSITSLERYDAILTASGQVQIRRVRSSGTTVLAQGPSGLVSLDDPATLTLEASGAGPVSLIARINGQIVATATDSSSAALTGAGWAGMWTTRAGVVFDDFRLTGLGSAPAPSSPPSGGPPAPSSPPSSSCPFGSTPLASGGCGLPDLEIDVAKVRDSWLTTVETFSSTDCEVVESCIGTGTHTLLEFDLRTWNVGNYDLVMGDPAANPEYFVFQSCHNHYHFSGFAQMRVLDSAGNVVAQGQKESFCIADSVPGTGSPKYSCDYMGLSVGWGDVYGASTPCQYIDITGVPSGSYTLEVVINPDRVIGESSYDNNTARIPINF
jgi:hypothetical protein